MAEHVSYLSGGDNETTLDGASRIATAIYSRSGVITMDDMEVTQRALGADRSVDIAIGQIVIGRGDYTLANQESYFFGYNTAVYNLPIGTNTSGNPRISAVVAYIDTSTPGPTDNEGALKFVEVAGTPAGAPNAPSDADIQTALGAGVRWHRLADIDVDNGFSAIINADITDRRAFSGARATLGKLTGYTSSTTWNKPDNLAYIEVEVQGAGGGGGGATTDDFVSCGGGGGGYARKIIPANLLGATETITVGVGGSGSDSTSGGAGGSTSFGTHVSASGGPGGAADQGGGFVLGGIGSGGDINIRGGSTSRGGPNAYSSSGMGGGSMMGSATPHGVRGANGQDGQGHGSGGGGGVKATGTNRAGGAGAGGRVIIREYF